MSVLITISVEFVAQIFRIKLMRRILYLMSCVVVSAGICEFERKETKQEIGKKTKER
jgi:hypothetical protein